MRIRTMAVCLTIGAMLGAGVLAGGAPPAAKHIDAKATKYLKAMSDFLAGLKAFSFQVEEFFDEVQDDGLKLQFSNQRQMTASRPNKLFGQTIGDTSDSQFFYDGKTVTVFDRKHRTYAIEKVPDTIDAMLDDLHERFGIDRPLVDFLYSDPYKVLTENVQRGMYIGLHHVGKAKCHHLAFQQKILDWQIWIDAGPEPLPRKFLITFKRQVDEPQYLALMHRWDVNPTVNDDAFTFQPPPNAQKVEFAERHGPAESKKKPEGQ
jgi:hypothetical protein